MDKRKSALATAAIFSILAIGSFVLLQEKEQTTINESSANISTIISKSSANESIRIIHPTTITVSPANVSVGDTFSIEIVIDPSIAIAGAQCSLAYNPSILAVNGISKGNLFSQDGSLSLFRFAVIDNINGTVRWIYGNILNTFDQPKNITSKGVFATVSMTAKKEGVSSLELITINPITVKVCNPEGEPVLIDIVNGSVNVTQTKLTGIFQINSEYYFCECQRMKGRG